MPTRDVLPVVREAHLRVIRTFAAMIAVNLVCPTALAHSVEPQSVTPLPVTADGARQCGLQAEYTISGSVMRVELLALMHEGRAAIKIRAYAPNSVGPMLRDLWLKTATIFTLGTFPPARDNKNGILEASGDVSEAVAASVVRDFAVGDAEISLVYDGVLPAARLAIGLPQPLPVDLEMQLQACADALVRGPLH